MRNRGTRVAAVGVGVQQPGMLETSRRSVQQTSPTSTLHARCEHPSSAHQRCHVSVVTASVSAQVGKGVGKKMPARPVGCVR